MVFNCAPLNDSETSRTKKGRIIRRLKGQKENVENLVPNKSLLCLSIDNRKLIVRKLNGSESKTARQ
jgi:hypothetical protein